MAQEGNLNPALYDFVETSLKTEVHENFEDLISDKIFKYKYRQFADPMEVYIDRMNRVRERFYQRLENVDPAIYDDLVSVYTEDQKATSLGQLMTDPDNFDSHADKHLTAKREFIVSEGL